MELDNEWDVERALQLTTGSLSLTGILLSTTQKKNWLALSLAASTFMMTHAVTGW
jgi:hypothetical protein